MQVGEDAGERVLDEIGLSDAELAFAVGELGARVDGLEERVGFFLDIGRQFDGVRLHERLEETFPCAPVVKAVQGVAQSGLGHFHTDLTGGDAFDGVCFVEDDEIIPEQVALGVVAGVAAGCVEEEEGVVHDHDVRFEQTFTGLLVEAAGVVAAGLCGADVCFTADFGPHSGVGIESECAFGAVFGAI